MLQNKDTILTFDKTPHDSYQAHGDTFLFPGQWYGGLHYFVREDSLIHVCLWPQCGDLCDQGNISVNDTTAYASALARFGEYYGISVTDRAVRDSAGNYKFSVIPHIYFVDTCTGGHPDFAELLKNYTSDTVKSDLVSVSNVKKYRSEIKHDQPAAKPEPEMNSVADACMFSILLFISAKFILDTYETIARFPAAYRRFCADQLQDQKG